jgi:ribosome silencing factor RsfS/YbeB/iojap
VVGYCVTRFEEQEAAIARTPKAPTASAGATAPVKRPAKASPAPRKPAEAAPKRKRTPKAAAPEPKPVAPKAAPKAAPKTTARAKPKPEAKVKAAPVVKAKPGAKAKPEAKAKATPVAKAKPTAKAKPVAKAKPAAKTKPAAKAKPASPRPARAANSKRQKVAPALLDRLVAAAQKSLEDDKAENVLVLDVTGRADYADRLVIATGLVDRQIQAMATHLEDAFEKEGLKLRRDATQASPDWVLIDAGDLVIHLFKPEARRLYALERMWGPDSPAAQDRAALPDDGSVPEAGIEDDDLPRAPKGRGDHA